MPRLRKSATPPNFPKNSRQDSWGNPTTKKPGDPGTQVGRHGVWWDMSGAYKPHGTRDWAKRAKSA